nr:protein APEM9 [Tanacetum cinerariifolium]
MSTFEFGSETVTSSDIDHHMSLWEQIELAESYLVCSMFEEASSSSSRELGRTLDIITELTQLYGSLVAIPVQVFLAGICFQMQVDPHGAQKTLEEFLSKWKFVNQQFYVMESQETDTSYIEGHDSRFVLEADTYLQVVEAYITLLTGIL